MAKSIPMCCSTRPSETPRNGSMEPCGGMRRSFRELRQSTIAMGLRLEDSRSLLPVRRSYMTETDSFNLVAESRHHAVTRVETTDGTPSFRLRSTDTPGALARRCLAVVFWMKTGWVKAGPKKIHHGNIAHNRNCS